MKEYTTHIEGTKPTNGEIWVFGSNLAGRHGAGAALIAMREYGATYRDGIGLQGQSYAIPTKDEFFNVLRVGEIEVYVETFLKFARQHPEMAFFVTGIGCGYAGYCATDIAPLFKDATPNVSLPDIFVNVLHGTNE